MTFLAKRVLLAGAIALAGSWRISIPLMLTIFLSAAATAQVSDIEVRRTEHVFTAEALAEEWHLSPDEWAEYKALMEGPRGLWSPALDPITALGIHAETEADRRRYAELLVMVEFERAEQELKFQRAYDEAARRLFPQLSPVGMAGSMDVSPFFGADRIAFVGSVDSRRCPTCRRALARWLRDRRSDGPTLDLFLDDATDDAAIRAWAAEQGIDPADVVAGRITLNHARSPLSLPPDEEGVDPRLLQRVAGRWLPLETAR